MTVYNQCWAEDVVHELHHDYRDQKAVDWVLRWMKRNESEPEENSIMTMADTCKNEFFAYIGMRKIKSGE